MKLHKRLSNRIVKCTKSEKTKVSPEQIKEFLDNFAATVKDVCPENIINYDESAFVDSGGDDKVVVRRGLKYPIVIRDNKKTSISVMVSGTASGYMLPPYTVYKSECLWDKWVLNGLHGARYNRKKSG